MMSVASPVTTWVSGSGRLHHQTISIIVENRAGVLARISALFARRGFNIISLAVAPTDDDAFSRVTIVVDLEETSVEQLTKQLFKLVNIVKITELTPGEAIERELALLSVRCAPPGGPGPSRGRGRGPGADLRGHHRGRRPRGAYGHAGGPAGGTGRLRRASETIRDYRDPAYRPGGPAQIGAAPVRRGPSRY